MPIYEFECGGCKQVFEVRQKFDDPPPESHTCGSKAVKRILSNTSFVLKGTGWYKTDYANASKQGTKSEGNGGSGESPAKKDAASGDKKSTSETSGGTQAAKSPPATSGGKSGGGGSEAA